MTRLISSPAQRRAVPNDATGNNDSASADVHISISCKTCYITGLASAELKIESNDTFIGFLNQTIHNVETEVDHIIDEAESMISNELKNIVTVVEDLVEGEDIVSVLAPPKLDISLDVMNLTHIPNTTLTFRFDGLDIYLDLDVNLTASASYTLPLYSSANPAQNAGVATGMKLPNELELGVFFTVDLILNVNAEVDMNGGFHIKVDDYVAMEIALFGSEVSGIEFKGAQYEFIPVTVYGAKAVFTAMLQLGARAALKIGKQESFSALKGLDIPGFESFDPSNFQIGGGLEVGVYADVAVFTTNITEGDFTDNSDKPKCEGLQVVQDYSLVLSATAGAQTCIDQATRTTAVAATTAAAQKRQDSSQTVTTEVPTTEILIVHIATAIECPATITGPCPVSLQSTIKSTQTLTATVAPVSNASPTTTAIPFGTKTHTIHGISGSPTLYTPTQSDLSGIATQVAHAVENHKQIALGVGIGVGLGIPILAVIACIAIFCIRRRKYATVLVTEMTSPSPRQMSERFPIGSNNKTGATVREAEFLVHEGTDIDEVE